MAERRPKQSFGGVCSQAELGNKSNQSRPDVSRVPTLDLRHWTLDLARVRRLADSAGGILFLPMRKRIPTTSRSVFRSGPRVSDQGRTGASDGRARHRSRSRSLFPFSHKTAIRPRSVFAEFRFGGAHSGLISGANGFRRAQSSRGLSASESGDLERKRGAMLTALREHAMQPKTCPRRAVGMAPVRTPRDNRCRTDVGAIQLTDQFRVPLDFD